jgi:predicted unusual protein kinase regulating ubiquinone biosynthesis (AarF/ABC1/UbiB family)
MPRKLRRLLEIHLETLTATERALLFSHILAEMGGRPLDGPEVVKLVLDLGGITGAKLAQLIASHGFDLDPRYQRVLQIFKGGAQKVAKAAVARAFEERLHPARFAEIVTLDQGLGSGAIKIGYVATLTSGKRIALKLSRELALTLIAREFEVLREDVRKVMADPELEMAALPGLAQEVERLIREELDAKAEVNKIYDHIEALGRRPFLVRWFGQKTKVLIPKPLPEWTGEGVSAEEFIDGETFDSLPATADSGWSKERLAMGAIEEIINELMAAIHPDEQPGGFVMLDVDPHEENHVAHTGRWGRRVLGDIDFGQSVRVAPERARRFLQLAYAAYREDEPLVMTITGELMDFRNPEDSEIVQREFSMQRARSNDPIEVLSRVFEEVEKKGVLLKSDLLYLQKLFATAVGLKSHIRDEEFVLKTMRRAIFLRLFTQGSEAVEAVFPGARKEVPRCVRWLVGSKEAFLPLRRNDDSK